MANANDLHVTRDARPNIIRPEVDLNDVGDLEAEDFRLIGGS
jgi:hypothetical protein